MKFPGVLVLKNPPGNGGDIRHVFLIPGSGRSPGGGHGNPLQYSCLENSMDRGGWRATVHGVAKSWTWLKPLGTLVIHIALLQPCSSDMNGTKTTSVQFSSIQSLSLVGLFVTPWIAAHQASLSIANSQSSLKLTSIESVMPSSHLILCHPLLLLPLISPSIRVFSNEWTLCMRWPKYWSFSFSISPSKELPGLISFRMDWLDLLAVQGTLKSLLQHHSSKASTLQHSAFFTVQL